MRNSIVYLKYLLYTIRFIIVLGLTMHTPIYCWSIFLTFFLFQVFETRVVPKDATLLDDLSKILPGVRLTNDQSPGCMININKDFAFPEPLLMTHHTEGQKREYLQPINNTKGMIYLNISQQIELHCSHGFKDNYNGTFLKATCLDRTTFVINYRKTTLKQVSCNRNTFHTTQTIGECKNNGTLVQIGYEVKSMVPDVNNNIEQTFHKLITICMCKLTDRTYWSHNILTKANIGSQNGVPRPSFIMGRDHFTSKGVNGLYSRNNQIEKLTEILGSQISANVLISERQSLNRGHLTPKADMIMGTFQRATFYFINVQPQWSTFNSGNWAKIEEAVRRMVADRNLVVDVYTGTHGIVSYKNVNGDRKEFYLNYDENGNGLIPVPKIFYKLIVDKKSGKGVVLIGVNNPYVTLMEIKRDYIFCDDVSNRIKWVYNIQERIPDGYYYACNVSEFSKAVETLPQLNVTGLLI